ncbi:O-antigen ligase family protein [Paenibacillus tepidiphilus]|uniref:O-antigen ligase family protein n=1 Tax=Paenibacillus tepidiphilus TaxID=2608683 RepID=UPI0013A57CB8|nr:O-antigen ligase family protein [Paenibacillus tepidiphilus]
MLKAPERLCIRMAERNFLRMATLFLLGCPFLFQLMYALQLFRSPVSLLGTWHELLRWGLYGSFAVIAYCCAQTRRGGRLLVLLWNLTGMLLGVSALLAVCGGLNLPYAVAYSASPAVSATGARLAGVLEYPNAFGAVMAVFLLESLFAAAAAVDAGGEAAKRGRTRVAGGSRAAEARGLAGIGQSKEAGTDAGGAAAKSGRTRMDGGSGAAEAPGLAGIGQSRGAETDAGGAAAGSGMARAEDGQAVSIKSRCAAVRGWAARCGAGPAWKRRSRSTLPGAAPAEAALRLRLLPLFPYAAALLLSESRGAWLAAAAACAAALLRQPRLLAPLLAAGAAPLLAAALLYRQLAAALLAAEPWPGLALLAGLWAAAWLAGLWLCRRRQRAAGRAGAAVLAAAVAGWAAAGAAALWQVRERISGPSPTAGARGLLYRDAWRLAGEAPWLGRGGESWRSLYLAAQSRPYVGSQVHSGYLDTLLNLGVTGLSLTLLMLLAAGWLCAQAGPRLLAPLLVIALHAAVDFDWSYGLIWLLLFMLPAMARAGRIGTGDQRDSAGRPPAQTVPPEQHLPAAPGRPSVVMAQADLPVVPPAAPGYQASPDILDIPAPKAGQPPGFRGIVPIRAERSLRKEYGSFIAALSACSLCLLLALCSLRALLAAGDYREALRTTEPEHRQALLLQARERNPLDPMIVLTLSRTLPASEGVPMLQAALAASPVNAALQWEVAGRYLQGNTPGRGLQEIRQALALDRYNAAKWQEVIAALLTRSERKLAAEDFAEAAADASAGRELLRQYRLLAGAVARQGQRHNDRRFAAGGPAEALQLRLDKLPGVYVYKPEE